MSDNPYAAPQIREPSAARSPDTISTPARGLLAYRGVANWALVCSLAFIVSELLWHCSRNVKAYDLLEIPLDILHST